MVNTKHDAGGYDRSCYKREIYDGNTLYEAYLRAKRGSDWKPQVQAFGMFYLLELAHIERELKDRSYEFRPTNEFILRERGKIRVIRGEQIHDRVAKHTLCDNALMPDIEKYLIYDSGASITGKGITFTRNRLLAHLRRYYARNGTNEGYILLIDFSKYYDNIRHDKLKKLLKQYTKDDDAVWLMEKTIDTAKVDVSYMSDEEYERCEETLFNSLKYQEIDKNLLTGEKFMAKHLNIGDQLAQIAGIAYTIPIDNYVKIVKGVKYYARYMDDSYVIHESKEFLEELLKEINIIAASIGITINLKKTRICKLSDYWRFLQIQYSLTDTGRVIRKINPKRLTNMRRKMKKIASKLTEDEFANFFQAWFRGHYKYMSKLQRKNIEELFKKLRREECTQSHSQTEPKSKTSERTAITT